MNEFAAAPEKNSLYYSLYLKLSIKIKRKINEKIKTENCVARVHNAGS